jgi:hypothetical protein
MTIIPFINNDIMTAIFPQRKQFDPRRRCGVATTGTVKTIR